MPRLLVLLLSAIGVLAAILVLLVILAYGTGPGRADQADVPGLSAAVEVSVEDDGVSVVSAASEADLFAGLGYVHALRNAWPMTLWQVSATGARSSMSRDTVALALDNHVLTLGFRETARRTYAGLPDSVQALFQAYVAGVNASFAANRLGRADEFVAFDIEPVRWEPWHPLAIEQLMAYLAAGAPTMGDDPEARMPPAGDAPTVRSFQVADSLLRATLGVDGFSNSAAFAVADTAGTSVYHRLVYGNTALAVIQPVELRRGGRDVVVSTIPGTLVLLGGFAESHAWALVPTRSNRLAISTAPPPEPHYDRIVRHDGRERLVTARRAPGVLFLEEAARPPAPVDTLEVDGPTADVDADEPSPAGPSWWVLAWPGLEQGTDIAAWRALLAGEEPQFRLFGGGVLIRPVDGDARVAGAPEFSQTIPGGLILAGRDTAHRLAERLSIRDTLLLAPADIGDDAYSAWAARLATPLIQALGPIDSLAMSLRDPASFLAGWPMRYEPQAIGASVFEQWMRVYERNMGHLPRPDTLMLRQVERVDTVEVTFAELVAELSMEARAAGRRPPAEVEELAEHPDRADSLVTLTRTRMEDPTDLRILKRTFREAVQELVEAYGPPGAAWRWDRVQGAHLRFTGRTGGRTDSPVSRSFRDVPLGDGGHPTTVRWGPSILFGKPDQPAAWVMWASTSDWDTIYIRARAPFHESRIVRYTEPPEPTPVRVRQRGQPQQQVIRLSPPS